MLRVLSATWLLVQALVVAAAPIADAQVPHGELAIHWEDASDTSCPPLHEADSCRLCQLVATSEGAEGVARGGAPVPRSVAPPLGALTADLESASISGPPRTRAPPVA